MRERLKRKRLRRNERWQQNDTLHGYARPSRRRQPLRRFTVSTRRVRATSGISPKKAPAAAVFKGYSKRLRPSGVAVLVLLGLLVVYSVGSLTNRAIQTLQIRQLNKQLAAQMLAIEEAQQTEPEATKTGEPIPPQAIVGPTERPQLPEVTAVPGYYRPVMLAKFQSLYAQNNDLIGWLKVDCLYRIDFAVVKGKNAFYMNHDFTGRENQNGTAFLDETCKIWPRDNNLIIYAHNMKTGDMFGELNKMQYLYKLRESPFVRFDSLYESEIYIPLAVFICSVMPGQQDYFQFYVRNFKSEAIFEKYIEQAKQLSLVKLGVDAAWSDQLLTLVTCHDQANQQRLVVLLRKLRSNETEEAIRTIYFR